MFSFSFWAVLTLFCLQLTFVSSAPIIPRRSSRFSRISSVSDDIDAPNTLFSFGLSFWNTSSATPDPPARVQTRDPSSDSNDLDIIRNRRISIAVGAINTSLVANISSWVSTLGDAGQWPDTEVNYTSGCGARRANWPALDHWVRIETMAAAWHGGLAGADQFINDTTVLNATSRAMDWWFAHDFTEPGCLTNGGKGSCPCGTPGLWNPNWFANVIGAPALVGDACLLLGPALTNAQRANCSRVLGRAFGTFGSGQGFLAGANILDIAKVGIAGGLLADNASMVADGYTRMHKEVVEHDQLQADGIRGDGSFGQHQGIIYNGNYGKDYANDVLALELAAAGTQFEAPADSKAAFETLMDGDQWMIFKNTKTDVLHWDFSVIQRMLTFDTSDEQASAGILVNVSMIDELAQLWNSDKLKAVAQSLEGNGTSANAGGLTGNRMFYANDYMVHRGSGYVSTLRMFSSRTQNSECVNSQNPYGFHLSDGTLYTYVEGDEYENIQASWDWNMIPGTTTDYAATPLKCDKVKFKGKETFVGGASDGTVGAAAMRYTNPDTGSLSFQKAWFFLDDDVQHIMLSHAGTSPTPATSSAPLISVLDQKRLSGDILVDGRPLSQGGNFSKAATLWHDNVGYAFPGGAALSVDFGARSGDWGRLGISTAGESTTELFSAWVRHGASGDAIFELPTAYTAFPGTDADAFASKVEGTATALRTVQNDASVSAVYDAAHRTAMAVFWDDAGGAVTFTPDDAAPVTMKVSAGAIVVYRMDTGALTVSDPTQSKDEVDVTLTSGDNGAKAKGLESGTRTVSVSLPSGGAAGKSVTQSLAS